MRFLLECALFLLLLEIKGHHSEWAPHIASKLLEISPSQHVAGKVLDLGHKTTLHVNNEVGPILCEDDNGCGHKKVTTPSILVPQIFFAKSPKSQKVLKTALTITKTAKDITASVDDISDSDSTEKKPSKALKQKKTPETTKTEKITRNRKDVTESDDDVSNDDSSDKKPHKGQKRMIVQKNTKHRKRPRNHKDMTESDDDDDTTEKKPSKAPKRNNKTRKRPKITKDILLSKSDGDVNNYDDTTDEKPPKAPKRKKTPKNKKTRKRPRTPKDISESDYDVSEDDSTDPKKQKKGPQNIKARKITKNPKDISESDYDVSNDDIANSMTTEEKDSSSDESLEDKWSKKKHHKKHKSHKVNRIAYIGSIKNVVKSGVMAYEWNSGEVKQKRKYRAKKYKTALKHEIEKRSKNEHHKTHKHLRQKLLGPLELLNIWYATGMFVSNKGNSKQICILNVNGEYCVRHNTDTRSKTYEGMEIL